MINLGDQIFISILSEVSHGRQRDYRCVQIYIYVPFLLNVITNHPNYVSLLWEKQFLEHSKHCFQLASLSDIYVLCYISFSKSMVRHENQNKVQKLNDSPVEQMLTAAFCWLLTAVNCCWLTKWPLEQLAHLVRTLHIEHIKFALVLVFIVLHKIV